MQADRQHPGVVPEDRLHPVAVVNVDIDVRDPLDALPEHPRDGDRGIVVHTEPARPVGHRVVQPAADVDPVIGPAGQDGACSRQRRPGDQRARPVHAGKDGIVRRTEAVGRIGPQRVAGQADGVEITGGVAEHQLVVGGSGHAFARGSVQYAESLGERHRELDPDRRHRVTRPEVVGQERDVPGNGHGAGHAGQLMRDDSSD
jgi:hypothetical protein